jgi:hypothetical protein
MSEMMNMTNTLIWSLHNLYIYQNITLYPINMYNYHVSIENKTYFEKERKVSGMRGPGSGQGLPGHEEYYQMMEMGPLGTHLLQSHEQDS